MYVRAWVHVFSACMYARAGVFVCVDVCVSVSACGGVLVFFTCLFCLVLFVLLFVSVLLLLLC